MILAVNILSPFLISSTFIILYPEKWTNHNQETASTILEDLMMANSVKERFNTCDAAEKMVLFEQVRIPLCVTKGKAKDAEGFAKNSQDF